MARTSNIEIWTGYDPQGIWTLHIKKKRGNIRGVIEMADAMKEILKA